MEGRPRIDSAIVVEEQLLSLTPPAIPMWAVFYNERDDSLFASPIVTLALVRVPEWTGENTYYWSQEIRPLCFMGDDGMDYWWERPDAIGYLNSPPGSEAELREKFADEIARNKKG